MSWLGLLIKCYMSRTGLTWGESLNIDRSQAVLLGGQEVKLLRMKAIHETYDTLSMLETYI
jgi:hypothetical protein